MLGSRTDLHIFDAGSVNGTRYYDNAPCHRTVAAEQLLESEDIERKDWPARSPDLNPIEHVCAFLGRRLAARTLRTNNDSGASIGAARRMGSNASTTHYDPHSQHGQTL
ncbi:hypothetical protein TNCV_2268401 [Trichonephila clavipes]|nr:hypothetical protein TNCV_2268401 [Trichonephila clavipes]